MEASDSLHPGGFPHGPVVATLLWHSTRDSTRKRYEQVWKAYERACDRPPRLPTLPVSKLALGRFIAEMHEKGNAPSTISQNLSAVYESAVRLREAVEPTVKMWASLCVKGAYNLRAQQIGPPPLRAIVPPQIVLGVARSLEDCTLHGNTDDRLTRARGLVVLTFLFCLRADSVCAVQRQHLTISTTELTLLVVKFKGRTAQYTKKLVVPLSASLAQAVASYARWWDSLGLSPSTSLFGYEPAQGQPAAFVTSRLGSVLSSASDPGFSEPIGSLSSHSLRRGAAVCMYTLRVPEHVIMEWAGWESLNSMTPYVRGRVSVKPTDFDLESFGWLLRTGVSSSTLA
jgi:integrase